jgi:hypothetical protein
MRRVLFLGKLFSLAETCATNNAQHQLLQHLSKSDYSSLQAEEIEIATCADVID